MKLRRLMILLCAIACDGSPATMELGSGVEAGSVGPPPLVYVTAHQDATVGEVWERQRLLIEAGVAKVSVLPHHPWKSESPGGRLPASPTR